MIIAGRARSCPVRGGYSNANGIATRRLASLLITHGDVDRFEELGGNYPPCAFVDPSMDGFLIRTRARWSRFRKIVHTSYLNDVEIRIREEHSQRNVVSIIRFNLILYTL